jgi:alpha-L-rhamnosidase
MIRLLTVVCLLTTIQISAQEFKASWIAPTADKHTPLNTWYCYRKTFDIKDIPANATAKIATDTKYWLWINGKLVVYEGGLKRGPNPNDTYYDEVNLSSHLMPGKNTIAVLVWFWGGKGLSHNNSGQSALLFDCTIDKLISDKSWKAIQYNAFMPSTAPKPNFRLSEPNILYDARKEIKDWQHPSFNDVDWKSATELGKVPLAPWNQLVKRNIPLFKFDKLNDYTNTERRGDTLICHLPYNGQFSPYLKVRAQAGQKIFIGSDTWHLGTYPGDTLNTLCSEYITRNGLQEYESLGWLSGHEIHYVIPKGIEVISLKYRETGYASEMTGSFNCNDTFFNRLWQKTQRTLVVNMRDNYMDCPDRERAQWAGDAAMEMAQAFYALDGRSTDLSRKLFLDLVNWQRADSTIYNPVPESDWKKELPVHSLMP